MNRPTLRLKKNEDRRLRAGHLWIYSNEVDTHASPLKNFTPDQDVLVESQDKKPLGLAYVNPHSLITARLLTTNPQELIDKDFFVQRLQQALTLRTHFFTKPYYRLIFGESDGLPGLVIDRYDQTFVIQLNTAGMNAREKLILDAVKEVFPSVQTVLFRNDSSARQYEGLPSEVKIGFGVAQAVLQINENDTLFEAPFSEGQKTGWFYDHRLNRSRLKSYVRDQNVLDVFSYLGAWGIEALTMGAKSLVAIDASPLSAKWILHNAKLNHVENQLEVITEDAFHALRKLISDERKFSVIILDPPAFVKKQKDLKEGLQAYQRLNELAFKLLEPGGFLISCSCSMHVSEEDFLQTIRRAAIKSHVACQIIERGHQAEDHPVHIAIPETDYLKMMVLRKT